MTCDEVYGTPDGKGRCSWGQQAFWDLQIHKPVPFRNSILWLFASVVGHDQCGHFGYGISIFAAVSPFRGYSMAWRSGISEFLHPRPCGRKLNRLSFLSPCTWPANLIASLWLYWPTGLSNQLSNASEKPARSQSPRQYLNIQSLLLL